MERWTRTSWHWLAFGVLLAALAWQTLRIEGLVMGPAKLLGRELYLVDRPGLKPRLATCEGNLAAILRAQAEAEMLQAAVNEDEERRSAANAERSDASHAQDLERAAVAGRDFARVNRITAGGVRGQAAGGESVEATATVGSGSAGLSAQVPADPLVAVSSPDMQACTAAVTYAVAAHNWAATINDRQAKPVD